MDKPAERIESETAGARPDSQNVVPIVETLRSQANTREREQRFNGLLDALPAAVYTTDAAGRITYYNEAAAELWGHRPVLGTSEWCGSWKLYWADGTPLRHDQCPMAICLKEQRPVRGMEAACERPDGTRVPFIPYPTPLFDETGKLTGAVNMLVDITERKRAEDRQGLLVRELHHRVKNTLATVQAIMGSTARSSTGIQDFQTALIGRIGSLARTHLLLADEGEAVDFAVILRSELDAFDDGSEGRISLNGPPVEIPARLAVSLAMAIHELTTNAVKYGVAIGVRRQGRSDLARHHRGDPPHARHRLGGKRRAAGDRPLAHRLRHAAPGNRDARAGAGQDPHRIRRRRRARALRGAAAGGEGVTAAHSRAEAGIQKIHGK